MESETPPGLDPEARASNREHGQRTGDKGESFERFRMAFPNIDPLSTNRTVPDFRTSETSAPASNEAGLA